MSQYEIKEFYGKDALDYKKLCCVMFRSKNEALKDEEEYKLFLEKEDSERKADFNRVGAFYEGQLYGAIENHAFLASFDGNVCKMNGIGGVVSDFNSPFKGAMKQVYARSFEIMREKKQYISHLYPFEENYYRQYGYDITAQTAYWSIPIEKLIIFKEGVVKPYDGTPSSKEAVKDVFNEYASDKNLMLLRDEEDWEKYFQSIAPYVSGNNSYLHYDCQGKADAFMIYNTSPQADRPQNMVVSTLWFKSLKGLRGILSYFAIQRSYCDKLVITLPESIDISAIVDSTGGWGKRDTARTIKNAGTTRVVDAEEILKIAKYKGEGSVGIKIYDDIYAPWNNDTFTVEFGKETKVTRGGEADIEMKINSFTTGIMGRYDLEYLPLFEDVKINANYENLKKVFYPKHVYIEGHF